MEQNQGINRLAGVLQARGKALAKSPTMIDIGEIQGDFSLLTNEFPIPIPQ